MYVELSYLDSTKQLTFQCLIQTGSNHLPVINDENGSALVHMSTTCRGAGADWTSNASSVSHIFVPSSSGDSCYLGEDCRHSGMVTTIFLVWLDKG